MFFELVRALSLPNDVRMAKARYRGVKTVLMCIAKNWESCGQTQYSADRVGDMGTGPAIPPLKSSPLKVILFATY
jgi:hypothetical protein